MENRQRIAAVNSQVQDSLAGIRVIKSFANEDLEKEKFRRSTKSFWIYEGVYKLMGFVSRRGSRLLKALVCGGSCKRQLFCFPRTVGGNGFGPYALYITAIFLNPLDVADSLSEQFPALPVFKAAEVMQTG